MTRKAELIVLLFLATIQFTNVIDFIIMMPLGPQLMRVFQITPQQFGIVVSSYAIAAFVSGISATFFIDRFDRKKALLVTFSGFILGTTACGLAGNYWFLVIARVLTGLFGGIIGAQILSIVADIVPFERRGKAMGIVMSAFSFASAIGVPLGLFIASRSSWNIPFLAVALLGIPVLIACMIFLPSMTRHLEKPKAEGFHRQLLHNKDQKTGLLLMIVMMLGHFSVIPYIATYMVRNVGFSENELVYIYLTGGFVSIFTGPLIGKLADRIGKKKTFVLFLLLTLIPVIGVTHLPPVAIWVALCVTALFFIFSGGRFIPAQALISETVEPQYRGSYMAIISAVQQLAAGLGSFIGGLILLEGQHGELINYPLVGYFSVTVSLLTLLIIPKLGVEK